VDLIAKKKEEKNNFNFTHKYHEEPAEKPEPGTQ